MGHLFKCPNGHPFFIGECGGPTDESKCLECGERVGGQGHRLAAGNTAASELLAEPA